MDVFARLLHNPHIGVQMRTVEMQPFAKRLYWEQKKRDQFYWISISANLSQKECVASSWLSSNCSSMRILLITGNHFPSTNPRVWPIHGPAALGRLLMLKTTIVLFNPWTSHLQSPWKRNFLGRLVKILGCEEINRPTVKSMESFSASEPSEFRTLRFFFLVLAPWYCCKAPRMNRARDWISSKLKQRSVESQFGGWWFRLQRQKQLWW